MCSFPRERYITKRYGIPTRPAQSSAETPVSRFSRRSHFYYPFTTDPAGRMPVSHIRSWRRELGQSERSSFFRYLVTQCDHSLDSHSCIPLAPLQASSTFPPKTLASSQPGMYFPPSFNKSPTSLLSFGIASFKYRKRELFLSDSGVQFVAVFSSRLWCGCA